MVKDGIDVSQYQGEINWELVKNHIDFAILRCGFGQDLPGQDDPTFKRNADECTRLGLSLIHIYIFLIEGMYKGNKGLKIESPLYAHNDDGSYTNEIRKMFGEDINE